MSAARQARPIGILDHALGAAMAAVYVATLVRSARTLGYARDEGFYFRAAESYARWFELLFRDPRAAVARSAVDGAWGVNHEHPALVKSLFALSWTLFYKRFHLFAEEGTSFRFGGMLFGGALLWLLYIWGARARSRTVGLGAALAIALMPRVYHHAHLDCFDVPITFMWALTAYAYWRSLSGGGWGWSLATGVFFGLALDAKHNSWFLPFAFVAHTLLSQALPLVRGARRGRLRVPLALPAMALLGPLVFVALWPWLWFDTAERIRGYVQFHLGHDYYNMVFLGQTYWKPPMPRGYAWVMTLATVPVVTLAAFAIGLAVRGAAALRSWRLRAPRDPAATDLLWLLGLLVCYAPWWSPNTPIFGGTKHWMTAYPFLCLFAGCGVEWVIDTIAGSAPFRGRRALGVAWAAFSLTVAPLFETWHAHPWGLTFYTPLVGGAPGAASLGLNRGFWGYTTGAVAGFLNDHVPRGGTVFLHDTAWDSWDMLKRDGRIRADINAAGMPHQGTFALYHHEEHMEGVEYQIWQAYGTATPVDVGAYDGVPVVWVFARPGAMVNVPSPTPLDRAGGVK